MESVQPSYLALKQTDSGYALLKAASTPYEYYAERSSPELVPSLSIQPESQLTDIVTTDLVVDPSLNGYVEVYCEPTPCVRMTANVPDVSGADDVAGKFIYQFGPNGNTMPFSSYLDKAGNRYRSIQRDATGQIPIQVNLAIVGGLRILRENLTGALPILLVTSEYSPGPGVWLPCATPNSLFEDVSYGELINIPVGALAFRLRLAMQSPRATQLAFHVTLAPDSGSWVLPNIWSTLRPYGWPFLSNLPDCSSFRRIACDALVTWTGSSLDNGGKVAVGLATSTFCPLYGQTAYASVAALRANRYDGPIKAGGHATWRPGSLVELDHQDVYAYNPASMKITIGYDFADVSGSARLRVFGMFGFTSNNPIIGRMIWVPPVTESMKLALSLYYANYPACTNNRDHVALKALGSGVKGITRVVRKVLDKDDQLAALAMAFGQPELAAGIKAAGKLNKALPRKTKKKVTSVRAGKQPIK